MSSGKVSYDTMSEQRRFGARIDGHVKAAYARNVPAAAAASTVGQRKTIAALTGEPCPRGLSREQASKMIRRLKRAG